MTSLFAGVIQALIWASSTPKYPRFADVMSKHGYDWRAHEVTTEDGYILTTFHILGKSGQPRQPATSKKGTVLCQHGAYEDGADWLISFTGTPFHFHLVDQGYDVWLSNARGTDYSQKHVSLSAEDDDDYWLFGWAQMGLYDNTANIRMIKEKTGVDKLYYIGYSQGTTQMFYGLAHLEKQFHANHLHKIIQMAPCFYPGATPPWDSAKFIDETIMRFQDYGIYSFNGPDWDDNLAIMCDTDNFPQSICDQFTYLSNAPPQSVQAEKHYVMNGVTKRFQEYADQWQNGKRQMPLIPLEDIKQVPIVLFTGSNDDFCPREIALEHIPRFGSKTTHIKVEGVGHEYFCTEANSDWFLHQLVDQLQVPTPATTVVPPKK